jgi:hypothetical protein
MVNIRILVLMHHQIIMHLFILIRLGGILINKGIQIIHLMKDIFTQ